MAHSPHVFVRYLPIIKTERRGKPGTRSKHGSDHFGLFRSSFTEEHGFGRGFDNPAELRERNRFIVNLDFPQLDEPIDKRS